MEYIKKTHRLNFPNVQKMAIWQFGNFSKYPNIQKMAISKSKNRIINSTGARRLHENNGIMVVYSGEEFALMIDRSGNGNFSSLKTSKNDIKTCIFSLFRL